MTSELTMLAWLIVLGLAHVLLYAGFGAAQNSLAYNMGARDEPRPLTGIGARMQRAAHNFLETFPFFAAAVLIAHVAGRHNQLTWWGAQLYFWGRLAYLPLYATGVPLVRSLVWGVALVGILAVLAGLA